MAYSNKPFIIPIFLPHAGCPHRCVFCNQSLITGVNSRISPRSGFKTSDQVRGQGAGRSRKRSIHGYVSIYRRPVLHPVPKNQMRIPLAGQRSHWALDGVLKPLLISSEPMSSRMRNLRTVNPCNLRPAPPIHKFHMIIPNL